MKFRDLFLLTDILEDEDGRDKQCSDVDRGSRSVFDNGGDSGNSGTSGMEGVGDPLHNSRGRIDSPGILPGEGEGFDRNNKIDK